MNPIDSARDLRNVAPFDATIFDFMAATAVPAIHACGAAGTEMLLDWLEPHSTDAVLEVGCGSGHTLALIMGRFGCHLTGVDANSRMLATCRRRLRFCGVAKGVELVQADVTRSLPFPDEAFDKVYCESVLGFQTAEQLTVALAEIHRVLKPGGRFVANETVWLAGTTDADIAAWNDYCVEHFGIMQAAPGLKGPLSLKVALAPAGFGTESFCAAEISASRDRMRSSKNRIELRSRLYSRWRLVRSGLNPALLRRRHLIRQDRRKMNHTPQHMQGWLVMVEKPDNRALPHTGRPVT